MDINELIKQKIMEKIREKTTTPETDILGAAKHGLSQSWPGLLISAGMGYKSDFKPDTTAEKIVSGIAEYTPDIAALFLSGGSSAIGSAGKALGKGAVKEGLKLAGKKAYPQAMKALYAKEAAKAGGKIGVAGIQALDKAFAMDAAKTIATQNFKKQLPKLLAKEVGAGAAEGGLYGLAMSAPKVPLRQYVNEGEVNPEEALKEIGATTAGGAVLGGGLGFASGGLAALMGKLNKSASVTGAGATESKVIKAYDKAVEQANAIKKGQNSIKAIDKATGKLKELEEKTINKSELNKKSFVEKAPSIVSNGVSKEQQSIIKDIKYNENKLSNLVSGKEPIRPQSPIRKLNSILEKENSLKDKIKEYKNSKKEFSSKINSMKEKISNIEKTTQDEISYGIPVNKKVLADRSNTINSLKDDIKIKNKELKSFITFTRNDLRKSFTEKTKLENKPTSFSKTTGEIKLLKENNINNLKSNLQKLNDKLQKQRNVDNLKLKEKYNIAKETTLGKGIKGLSTRIKQLEERKNLKLTELNENIKKSGLEPNEYLDALKLQKPLKAQGLLGETVSLKGTANQDMTNLKSLLYKKNLNKIGIYDDTIQQIANNKDSQFLKMTLNTGNVLDRIQTKTGEDLMTPFRNTVEASNIASKSAANFSAKIQDIEGTIKLHKLDPKRLSDLVEGIAKPINAAEAETTTMINTLFKEFHNALKEVNPNVGELENYLPVMRKMFLNSGVRGNVNITKDIGSYVSSFEKTRLLKELPELDKLIQERDVVKLLNNYNRSLTRTMVERNGFKQFNPIKDRLRLRGYNTEADFLDRWYSDALGLSKSEYNKLNATHLVNESKDYIEKLMGINAESLGKPGYKKAFETLSEYMYKSWVGTSPRTMLKQIMQNPLVGKEELGYKYLAKGRIAMAKGTHKDVLNKVKDILQQTRVDLTESSIGGTPTKSSIIGKILKFPGEQGMNLFTYLDRKNRELSFISAYIKAKDTNFNPEIFKTLLPSQKNTIMKVLATGDKEKAAIEFGKIMSDRINYLYNIIDKPELLRNELGRYLPFTTWGRNQANLYYNDVINYFKSGGSIPVKRAALPLLQIMALEKLTGRDFSGFTPIASIPGIASPQVNPALGGFIEETQKGNAGRAVLQGTTAIPLVNLIQKLNKGNMLLRKKK
jgi:hypothetical protein